MCILECKTEKRYVPNVLQRGADAFALHKRQGTHFTPFCQSWDSVLLRRCLYLCLLHLLTQKDYPNNAIMTTLMANG